jgi:hypothetical protein
MTSVGKDSDRDYSATELGSHWFQIPPPHPAAVDATVLDTSPPDTAPAPETGQPPGDVLRFGPGVPARFPADPPRPPRRRRGLRRYAPAVAVLLAVLGYLGWQRPGPPLAVESTAVRTDPDGPGCDGTAKVVGTVTTNGSAGTLRYRWVRSDGTESGTLEETLVEGQREARLHLLWTFRGQGTNEAGAELRILAPGQRTATARFSYTCP